MAQATGKRTYGQAALQVPEDLSRLTTFDDMADTFNRKCKIICTIGPSSRETDKLGELLKEGMDICRLNLSHGSHEEHATTVRRIREAVARCPGRHIGIMMDTQGPEIRTGFFRSDVGGKVDLEQGNELKLVTDYSFRGDSSCIAISYDGLCSSLKPGSTILCADGALTLRVKSAHSDHVVTEVMNSVQLGERKNCKLFGVKLDMPALQERDIQDIVDFVVPQGVDFLAISYVRNAADVKSVREALGARGRGIKIMAKIQIEEALRNIDGIIEASDAIMIARGDLGMEIPAENVFLAQKMIIARCNAAGRPVAVATQMLESMTRLPRPTRAEASDVANAVLDGADCVTLSGETAIGTFPTEAVAAMRRICMEAELFIDYPALFLATRQAVQARVPHLGPAEAVCASAVEAADDGGAGLILALTESGSTALLTAKYRPRAPILAASASEATLRRLQLCRGVVPVQVPSPSGAAAVAAPLDEAAVQAALGAARRMGMARSGDLVVVVHGTREEMEGHVNLVKIISFP